MITISILSMIFCILSVTLSSFILYSTWQNAQRIAQMKSRFTKNQALLDSLNTQISSLDQIIKNQNDAMEQLEKLKKLVSSRNHITQRESTDSTLHQGYERAKDLVRRGIAPDEAIFQKCNLTAEELELLEGI